MSFNSRDLRDALGKFITGVTVITTVDDVGQRFGITVNSFSSVSLDPPLVLWSQSITSSSFAAFRDSDRFIVNILAADQVGISDRFARLRDNKFAGVDVIESLGGLPIITGNAAHLECVKVASYPGGDHVVFLGRVENLEIANRRPLAFSSGKYMITYAHDLGAIPAAGQGEHNANLYAERLVCAELAELALQLGHTLSLGVWANKGPTIIYWEPSANPVSGALPTGVVLPVTQSATGVAFATHLTHVMTEGIVANELSELGQSAKEFEERVSETRAHGLSRAAVAKTSPLHNVSINAFSAPIFDRTGAMLFALTVTARATELASDWNGVVPTALKRAAAGLSRRLGFGAQAHAH